MEARNYRRGGGRDADEVAQREAWAHREQLTNTKQAPTADEVVPLSSREINKVLGDAAAEALRIGVE